MNLNKQNSKIVTDQNSIGFNISADTNVKHIAFGFYLVVVVVAFVRLITSFKQKETIK